MLGWNLAGSRERPGWREAMAKLVSPRSASPARASNHRTDMSPHTRDSGVRLIERGPGPFRIRLGFDRSTGPRLAHGSRGPFPKLPNWELPELPVDLRANNSDALPMRTAQSALRADRSQSGSVSERIGLRADRQPMELPSRNVSLAGSDHSQGWRAFGGSASRSSQSGSSEQSGSSRLP